MDLETAPATRNNVAQLRDMLQEQVLDQWEPTTVLIRVPIIAAEFCVADSAYHPTTLIAPNPILALFHVAEIRLESIGLGHGLEPLADAVRRRPKFLPLLATDSTSLDSLPQLMEKNDEPSNAPNWLVVRH